MIWFRKIRSVFVQVKKKVFGIEKSDLCLLNKKKSFSFKNIRFVFGKLKKLVLNLYVKKLDFFSKEKFQICRELEKN